MMKYDEYPQFDGVTSSVMSRLIIEARLAPSDVHIAASRLVWGMDYADIAAAGSQVAILGNLGTDTGCAITTQSGGFRVNARGMYRISYDVTYTATAAGTGIVQLYRDSVALPCAIAQDTVTAAGVKTAHVETVISLNSCPSVNPVISAQISGVAGVVNHVCASAVKLA